MSVDEVLPGSNGVHLDCRGEAVATSRRDGHEVQYSGHLDRDRMCITGSWVIKKSGLLGWISPPEGWGSFELYRKVLEANDRPIPPSLHDPR